MRVARFLCLMPAIGAAVVLLRADPPRARRSPDAGGWVRDSKSEVRPPPPVEPAAWRERRGKSFRDASFEGAARALDLDEAAADRMRAPLGQLLQARQEFADRLWVIEQHLHAGLDPPLYPEEAESLYRAAAADAVEAFGNTLPQTEAGRSLAERLDRWFELRLEEWNP